MKSPLLHRLRRLAIWATLDLLLFAGALAFSTSADTRGQLRKTRVEGCYCGCAQSKTSAGCTKMCEIPKYASRRDRADWTTLSANRVVIVAR